LNRLHGPGDGTISAGASAARVAFVKAVVCTAWGAPDVLRVAEVERPTPRRNAVRIRIVATSVTASDCIARALAAPRRYRLLAQLLLGVRAPRRPIFGMVLSGEIESVGRNVTTFQPGDQVFGLSQWRAGCYAEYVCWPASGLLAKRPANLS